MATPGGGWSGWPYTRAGIATVEACGIVLTVACMLAALGLLGAGLLLVWRQL